VLASQLTLFIYISFLISHDEYQHHQRREQKKKNTRTVGNRNMCTIEHVQCKFDDLL